MQNEFYIIAYVHIATSTFHYTKKHVTSFPQLRNI